MEYAILGLLLREQLTIYQLRGIFNQSFSLIYGDSYGSLQSALRRLLNHGFVRFEAVREGGRNKKIYHITAAGRERFLAWMQEDIPLGSRMETVALTRLYFLGELDQPARIQVLSTIHATLDAYLHVLRSIQEQNAPHYALEVPWVRYRLAMLDYALYEMKHSRRFFRNLIEKEREQKGG